MLAKYALFVNSILVLVLGCVMVAMSMVTRLQREEISLFESIDMDPVYFVLGMGAFVVFISLLGCLGALRESVWTLHFFCICVMMIFLLEIVTFVFALTLMSNIQGNITHSISKGIKQYGLNQKKDAVLDDLQQKYSCCGTKTYEDWNFNPFFNCSAHGHLTCKVPDSCCHPPVITRCGLLWNLPRTSHSNPNKRIFIQGCVPVLMNIFKMNAVIIGLSMLVIALLEIVSVVLAYLTIKGIYEKNSEQPFPSSI
ncbi:tetraspanin-33-like isoform X1 [Octopus vulgaris]|uniref:Tetraspanin-33-like isoform X1 n=2 Tax=Octopus TaxID=6643 RepID=A0AA36F881_OCTVU|nr:tetraspanin-33 isoform X1 [Octopus bimaculoides]XP_014781767.1 tetraspanin-33 isoform X1 [Octopus bimaculoides]XP_029641038.1 tetraspanin-33 isoform X1 [Octopus sinensis]XP_036362045.1 tetraspanin-33 isoform X1 [Octopus sinensis]XP_052827139.1 tetraspanin-33 isoform X1 [Octopus bimaculoides]XP_052827140.1 tetraspanin-33 isoform X1 [Octopus bimaculoides]CAI9729441.1 tetraspanin-33-like isoform X1 [Octopus vulgaris]|eukprot:XP_014781765.1 PREDICTED: tetraspanin-33-like isoform X1 [Octopus bimaculoides]